MASRLTTFTTNGLLSSSDSAPSAASAGTFGPRRTICKYVICSLGDANSVPCSSRAASRIVTLTPSSGSSFAPAFPDFPATASCTFTGSASTTASAGPEILRLWDRFRKWKFVNRRRPWLRPLPSVEGDVRRSPEDDASATAGRSGEDTSGGGLWSCVCSKRPNSSIAPSSNLRWFPNPPSTTVSKTRSLERG